MNTVVLGHYRLFKLVNGVILSQVGRIKLA